MYVEIIKLPFSGVRTGVQPHQKSTPSANHRNRASIQRDRAAASIDEEQQQVLQQKFFSNYVFHKMFSNL
jgi:hypothetical protein